MQILLLLGEKDEYLDYKVFETGEKLDVFLESITPLILANIKGEVPLRKRLLLLPKDEKGEAIYFHYAGAVKGFDVIYLEEKDEEQDE